MLDRASALPLSSACRCAELEEAFAGRGGERLTVGVEEVEAARVERDPYRRVGREAVCGRGQCLDDALTEMQVDDGLAAERLRHEYGCGDRRVSTPDMDVFGAHADEAGRAIVERDAIACQPEREAGVLDYERSIAASRRCRLARNSEAG